MLIVHLAYLLKMITFSFTLQRQFDTISQATPLYTINIEILKFFLNRCFQRVNVIGGDLTFDHSK